MSFGKIHVHWLGEESEERMPCMWRHVGGGGVQQQEVPAPESLLRTSLFRVESWRSVRQGHQCGRCTNKLCCLNVK